MSNRYATLPRSRLAALLPELLLAGQLIDRSAMAWCISSFGREEMTRIAIEEWMAASPIYTRRMQRALGYTGDDVVTIFKGLQLDIGAPPQFMDFRYTVHDRWRGEFHLDHCGALMDVEPMGERYVRAMCHDIEDPTFDATAVATNPKAQVRPVHRPPRTPADRHPHCAWTVVIDDAHPPVSPSEDCVALQESRAASLPLAEIDPSEGGRGDYSGPLLSDLDFADFSRSALVRMADEVCLQMHLLNLGFVRAVSRRTADPREICTKQLVGIAGVAAERIHRALELPGGVEGALRVLELHPLLNPANYVLASRERDALTVRPGPAHEDGAWISLCGPGSTAPLQAAVRAVDPRLDVVVDGTSDAWTARVVAGAEPAEEFDEVAVTRISTGSTFTFQPRKSLPITPVR
ncbi:hypothetical protein EIL87_09600 [Saccharopolyspora rhizosphaerae]|uniref:Uncharacterized protein n=1 Tax=Saccharopolyspora rhizosphaerae TaxID=2492662 RepID=A0A426JWH6_9PSEU|nr:hypothetical protein [Saccharopolyspora rhizosphaerae]RRO17534.1 hypothetical protein EIL87_09600 [Saccharopolyspora rhizosphaerae]